MGHVLAWLAGRVSGQRLGPALVWRPGPSTIAEASAAGMGGARRLDHAGSLAYIGAHWQHRSAVTVDEFG
jgi:hypothetical protein